MVTRLSFAALFLGASLFASQALAQAPAMPGQADLTISADTRRAVVDTLCDRVERYYVFPEKAREVARAIRKRMSRHEYDRITSSMEFSDSLTAHVQAVAHDLHLRVHYRHEPIPAQMDREPTAGGGEAHPRLRPAPELRLRARGAAAGERRSASCTSWHTRSA